MANLRANNLTGTGGRNAIDGSVFFDGESSYLTMPDSEDFNIGSSDFTIEFWMYKNDTSTYQHIFRQRDSGSAEMAIVLDIDSTGSDSFASGYFQMEWGANKRFVGVNAKLINNTWHHLALTKEGTTGRVFVNGVLVGTDTLDDIGNYSGDFYVGYWVGGLGYYFKGYISNFRICKGHAIYTANFTPPTQKLDLHAESVLLCCQDSDDPTQEATGKTITGFGNYYGNTTTNLITNGDFGTGDLTGWTTDQATTSVVSGSARIVPNSGVNGALYQQFTTVSGKQYKATMRVTNTPASNFARLHLGTGTDIDSANKYLYSGGAAAQNVGQGTYSFVFTPTGTTTTLWLEVGGGAQTSTDFDDISVVGHNVGPAPKILPPVGIDEGVVFDGDIKINSPGVMYFPTGDTSQRGRGRGAFAQTAAYPNTSNSISYIDIASQGTATNFGDLTAAGRYGCGNSSATRGVSGSAIGRYATMDYFTLATTGNALSFGTLTYNNYGQSSVANSTRIVWISGFSPSPVGGNINVMTYITTATKGNGTDFGDYTDGEKARYIGGNISSPTRGLAFGGYHDPNYTSNIDYVTIGTTGASQDFGDLSGINSGCPGCSDSTRGVIFGGYTSQSPEVTTNRIDMVTIATTGTATDFGDIPAAKAYGAACSNSIRGVHCVGGYPGTDNSMSYVVIQTTGNAQDFGDLPTGETGGDSCENNNFSDSHGGLS